MRYLLALLISLFCINAVNAGNMLRTDVFTIDSNGFSVGYRSEYVIDSDLHILFDNDYPTELAVAAVEQVNQELVDIKLTYSFSDVDYDHSSEIIGFGQGIEPFNLQFAPNTIFVHLGRGWANGLFAANLRAFENGEPACFVRIGKDAYLNQGASFQTQLDILVHEILHCLLWGHASNNPYVSNFDFKNKDNAEVLHRLFDKQNTLGDASVFIDLEEFAQVGFIGNKTKKTNNRINSVYTSQTNVRLIPGKYILHIDDKYRCKGKNKLCGKLKKAKKFKFKTNHKYAVFKDSKGIVKVKTLD